MTNDDYVMDEMVQAYVKAVNDHLGNLTEAEWKIERKDKAGSVSRVARIGLRAALEMLASPTPPKSASVPVERLEALRQKFDNKACEDQRYSGEYYSGRCMAFDICADDLAELIAEYK